MSNGVAVVGCGYWGKNLVRNFHALGALTRVCDADEGRARALLERHPGPRFCHDYAALLADDAVRAVVIATPAESHARMAAEALLADKDVFVEKPLALSFEDGERLVRLARQRGRILMVGHLLEYHPAILALQQLLDDGALGEARYIYSNRLNLGRVRREENILWSFAPHDIAVILRLVGGLPVEVTATGGAYLQPGIADVTVTNLLFRNGVRAHVFVSWLHPYKEQRLVVVGSRKMAVFNDVAERDKLLIYDQGIEWVNGEPVTRANPAERVEIPATEPLRAECRHFLECLETRRPPRTDGESGLRVLGVLHACQTSLQENGRPIKMEHG